MRNASESELSPSQQEDLRVIVGIMIPASEEFGVPGADDEAIISDMLRSMGRDAGAVRAALVRLHALAGGRLNEIGDEHRQRVTEAFLSSDAPEVATLGRVVLQCYYRDDRVVRSLGREARPPFPGGHKLEQGDWSLLDPVRGRPQMWRAAR